MHDILIVSVVALCTFITRAAPFVFFGSNKEISPTIKYLGTYLPNAVMAILIIYCLKSVNLTIPATFIPQFISIVVVVILHLWKRNTLLSILGGTLCHMVLLQFIFI
ncbi:MAG: AzlD domain-containing protein [Erysipelotrichales bacterium]|nr:AzlD domain-containing protein [Erysipelotrichales bacterium]